MALPLGEGSPPKTLLLEGASHAVRVMDENEN